MSQTSGRTEPKRLKGFRDYLPDVMAKRLALIDVIRREARLAGFQTIATPALEYQETLLGHGEETDKQVYRFADHGGRQVALRFDLTVPFARFIAEHQGTLAFPFKKLQMGDVWRGENTQKGRYREFMQCDLDIIGVDSAAADVEILAVFQRILSAMAFGPFTMAVGSRVVLSALIQKHLGLAAEDRQAETAALIAIDKLAKVGEDKVAALLGAIPGASAAGAQALLSALTRRTEGGDSDLTALRAELPPAVHSDLDRLAETLATVRTLTAGGRGRVRLDLTIARGLGYYTGIVFETTLDQLPGFGSVCSGGRYNDLASRFTTRALPGVGASIGLDRLLAGLEELGQVEPALAGLGFVAVATADATPYAMSIAHTLRAAGVACDVGLVTKVAQQFKHADRLGCPWVITVGTSERENGTFAIKAMASGQEQRDVPLPHLLAVVQAQGR